ncbi:glycosyltransferase family 2 protein [Lacinutrix gracilariae]|uniref:Glycosyltransferase family 2 protein n=1 Tax=Lacinutrix gracilariae TaxID=1747198 RepID=A0ABW5K2F8_9FLAO
MKPLVSIIIPTYNRAHLINDTLDSIIHQTYTNWECIVVDDGSTDNTAILLQQYIGKDARFQFFTRPEHKPKGANACRNFGFKQSKGDFINWFDSDDVMEPNKLQVQVDALIQNPEAPYCICQTKWIDKNTNAFLGLRAKQISSEKRMEDYILYKIFWSILAPVWKRSFIEVNGFSFDETLQQSQEYDFHIKALAINSNYIALDEALVSMYKHDENLSNNIFENYSKLESNIKVKEKIVHKYLHKLSEKGVVKLLEIQTLMFKDVLKARKFKLAGKLGYLMFKTLLKTKISIVKKIVFCIKMPVAYWSYFIFNKGYTIIKPIG